VGAVAHLDCFVPCSPARTVMDGAAFDKVNQSAKEYRRTIAQDRSRVEANRWMFMEVMGRGA